MNMRGVYTVLIFSVVLIALLDPKYEPALPTLIVTEPSSSLSPQRTATGTQNLLSKPIPTLTMDFYDGKCDTVVQTVRSVTETIVSHNENATAQLLRLMFHDCFIHGCDGSILLDKSFGAQAEINTKASETLKGFEFVAQIKEELERHCPGIVSCADILVLATRDAVTLSGGPFFPVAMGRRDSKDSYVELAAAEIPRPNQNVSETLRLFKKRQFSIRETVALLGAHNIGKMDCQFITPRLRDFDGTTQPDPTLSPEFLAELNLKCPINSTTSIPSGRVFGPSYYERLIQGRGLIAADQQLMANNDTADLVREYAADPTGRAFMRDFAGAMRKMSLLGDIGGSQGEVRRICSLKNNDTNIPGSTTDSAIRIRFNISILKPMVVILCIWVSRVLLSLR